MSAETILTVSIPDLSTDLGIHLSTDPCTNLRTLLSTDMSVDMNFEKSPR
jgi:hypothetical protein